MNAKALGFILNRLEASFPNHMGNVNYYLGRYADIVRLGVPNGCEVLAGKIQPYFDKVTAYEIVQVYTAMHAANQMGKTVAVQEGVCFNYQSKQVKGALACMILQSSQKVSEILESKSLALDKVIEVESRNAELRGRYLTGRHITLANISGFKEFKSCIEVSGMSLYDLGMNANQFNILSNVLNTFEALDEFMNKPTFAGMEVFEGLLSVLIKSCESIPDISAFFKEVVSYQAVSFDLNGYRSKVQEVKLAVAHQALSEVYRFDVTSSSSLKYMQSMMFEVHGEYGNYTGLPVDESEINELSLAIKALGSINLS